MYWVWRRELAVMLRAPILYVVGGLFLVVQGIAFAGLVGALSDPRRPAPLGALLEGQLAGTLLTWVLQLVVLTLLGMRAIADEQARRRLGAAADRAGRRGRGGASASGSPRRRSTRCCGCPTLAYLGVVAVFRADGGGWDLASIACGYAGAIALGAALLAWAIAASAATSTTLAAGALGFALLDRVFLVGELPALWPDLATDHPALGARARDDRRCAAGSRRSRAASSTLAAVLVRRGARGRSGCRSRSRSRARAGGAASELRDRAARDRERSPRSARSRSCSRRATRTRWDVSAARRNSLDPATARCSPSCPAPATLTIVEPTLGALEPIYDEVARVAERMADARAGSPCAASIRRRCPAASTRSRAPPGLQPKDLASNGGGRRRARRPAPRGRRVRARDDRCAARQGAPTFEQLAIEQALAGALAELAAAARRSPRARRPATASCSLETADAEGRRLDRGRRPAARRRHRRSRSSTAAPTCRALRRS